MQVARELGAEELHAQQRDTIAPDKAVLTQVIQGVPLAVISSNHAQAGGAAVHRVGLFGEREELHIL